MIIDRPNEDAAEAELEGAEALGDFATKLSVAAVNQIALA